MKTAKYGSEYNTVLNRNIHYNKAEMLQFIGLVKVNSRSLYDTNADVKQSDQLCDPNRKLWYIVNSKVKSVYNMFMSILEQKMRNNPNGKDFIKFVLSVITNQPDKDIYFKIHKKYKSINVAVDVVDVVDVVDAVNAVDVVDVVDVVIDRATNRVKSIHHINIPQVTAYLDVGCFDGSITYEIGKYYNAKSTHGADIKQHKPTYDNIIFSLYDGKKLPYPDNTFDLITCLMTLHHVPVENLSLLISEISRVMKVGGVLILREHDLGHTHTSLKSVVLDIMHDFYDYVWGLDLGSWLDSENQTNYNNSIHWSKLICGAGFKHHTKIKTNPNPKFNPFGHYTISYVKSKPINEPLCSAKDYTRILTDSVTRLPYRRRLNDVIELLHWGQRKLLLGEIEFLTIFMNKNVANNVYVVYAGSAPGTHIIYLAQLFPMINFELYDPRAFDTRLSGNSKIKTYQQYFTDDVARKWVSTDKQHLDKTILFISDIRTGCHDTMTPAEVEEHVKTDHEWQKQWYSIMKPKMAMFKFRLPWDDNTTTYLAGDIHIQAYPPVTSTETRLIVYDDTTKQYDNRAYEERMFHFNLRTRALEYENCLSHITPADKEYLTNEYDSVAEIEILKNYISYVHNYDSDELNQKIIKMSHDITKSLSNRRTLKHKHPAKQTIINNISELVKRGYIPKDEVISYNTYAKYIEPIYDQLSISGLIDEYIEEVFISM
jgi:ubiquinone/menaquinone biosynthesis C-methylase UbiE